MILLPLTLREGVLPALAANSLVLVGCVYYWLLTFRGYSGNLKFIIYVDLVLHFLRKQQYFLLPIPVAAVALATASVAGLNSARVMVM